MRRREGPYRTYSEQELLCRMNAGVARAFNMEEMTFTWLQLADISTQQVSIIQRLVELSNIIDNIDAKNAH